MNNRVPDCICVNNTQEYTMIPKSVIRNPNLSAKAKTVLNILLSNEEGWTSFKTEIIKYMQEGITVLETALKELEESGYLLRIRYRQTNPNRWAGSFWCYTNEPYQFNQEKINKHAETLINKGFQLQPDCYNIATYIQEARLYQPDTNNNKIIKINKKRIKNDDTAASSQSLKPKLITPGMFEQFWKLYPKKVDKGKCKTKWETLCRNKDRPEWKVLKIAIKKQKESDRWKKGFTPHPHTWLNQSRWLDDPEEMKDWKKEETPTKKSTSGIDYSRVDSVEQ